MSSNNQKVSEFLKDAYYKVSSGISSIYLIEKNELKLAFGDVKELASIHNSLTELNGRLYNLWSLYKNLPDDD